MAPFLGIGLLSLCIFTYLLGGRKISDGSLSFLFFVHCRVGGFRVEFTLGGLMLI
jgi:hypothetical protein